RPGGGGGAVKAGGAGGVSTNGWRAGAGLADAVKVVVVAAWLTAGRSAADRLGAKAGVPLNTAVSVWLPAVRKAVANTTWPPASRVAVPMAVVPAEKGALAPGVPAGAGTLAGPTGPPARGRGTPGQR